VGHEARGGIELSVVRRQEVQHREHQDRDRFVGVEDACIGDLYR
jgi:hypothetical protein